MFFLITINTSWQQAMSVYQNHLGNILKYTFLGLKMVLRLGKQKQFFVAGPENSIWESMVYISTFHSFTTLSTASYCQCFLKMSPMTTKLSNPKVFSQPHLNTPHCSRWLRWPSSHSKQPSHYINIFLIISW